MPRAGEAISVAVLRDQADLFGPVASDLTAWRLLSTLDTEPSIDCARPGRRHGKWRGRN